MLITHLISKSASRLSQENLELMDKFVSQRLESNFCLEMSQNVYLKQAYKEIFHSGSFVETISTFFNSEPADSCGTMYKILFSTVRSNCLQTDQLKTLISEIKEVLPCVLRQEETLLRKTKPSFEVYTKNLEAAKRTYMANYIENGP